MTCSRTIQTTPPTAEPISLAQAKRQLRVDGTDDDTLITQLISVARDYIEAACCQQLVTATFTQYLDGFPDEHDIDLTFPPVSGVNWIKYIDTSGTTQTLSASTYALSNVRKPGEVHLAYNQFWPTTRLIEESVQVQYTAGYATPFTADAATDVLTWSGRTPTDGESVRLSTTDGDLPAGLSTGTTYYVVNSSGSTCKLSTTSGGGAVNITDAGSGTHFAGVIPETAVHACLLLLTHLYEVRSPHVKAGEIPPQVQWLLSSLMWEGIV